MPCQFQPVSTEKTSSGVGESDSKSESSSNEKVDEAFKREDV